MRSRGDGPDAGPRDRPDDEAAGEDGRRRIRASRRGRGDRDAGDDASGRKPGATRADGLRAEDRRGFSAAPGAASALNDDASRRGLAMEKDYQSGTRVRKRLAQTWRPNGPRTLPRRQGRMSVRDRDRLAPWAAPALSGFRPRARRSFALGRTAPIRPATRIVCDRFDAPTYPLSKHGERRRTGGTPGEAVRACGLRAWIRARASATRRKDLSG